MSDRRAILVVARREVLSRLRERAFLVSTFVTIALIAVLGVLPALLSEDVEQVRVAVAGPAAERVAAAADREAKALDLDVVVVQAQGGPDARKAVEDGRADAALTGAGSAIVVEDELDRDLGVLLQQAAARIRAEPVLERLSPAERSAVTDPEPLRVERIGEGGDDDEARGVASIIALLLYGQLLMYGYWIAAGIVEEKASRVIEVLLSAIRPRQLLLGKLLGIGLLGFVQLLLVVGIGAGVVVATGSLDVPSTAGKAVAVVLAFFVLGYALYASMYAVAGAIVPRQEELQSSTTPLTVVVIASFFAAFTAVGEPDGTAAQALSFVPPCAPMVLPVRILAGDVPVWEIALAVALIVATAGLLVAVAIRIYTGAVLRTGARVSLRDAWRAG